MSGRRLRDAQDWQWGCRAAVATAPLTALAALLWTFALRRDEPFESLVPDALSAYLAGAVAGGVAGLVAVVFAYNQSQENPEIPPVFPPDEIRIPIFSVPIW